MKKGKFSYLITFNLGYPYHWWFKSSVRKADNAEEAIEELIQSYRDIDIQYIVEIIDIKKLDF